MTVHADPVRQYLVWAKGIADSYDHWWFEDPGSGRLVPVGDVLALADAITDLAAGDGLIEKYDALVAERDEYLQMVFADMSAENKEHRSYNAQGIRMRAEAAEAEVARLREALRGKCDCGHAHDRDTGCGDCSCDLWTCAALAKEATDD